MQTERASALLEWPSKVAQDHRKWQFDWVHMTPVISYVDKLANCFKWCEDGALKGRKKMDHLGPLRWADVVDPKNCYSVSSIITLNLVALDQTVSANEGVPQILTSANWAHPLGWGSIVIPGKRFPHLVWSPCKILFL